MMDIRAGRETDAKAICDIYNYYVKNTVITFEEIDVDEADMRQRIRDISTNYHWLVCEENNELLGYAYVTQWRARSAYRKSVEISIYLNHSFCGRGIGKRLYDELIKQLNPIDVHAVIAGIALPNDASVVLHERCGFEKIAHFKEVGLKFNQWIDVGYWQLILTP